GRRRGPEARDTHSRDANATALAVALKSQAAIHPSGNSHRCFSGNRREIPGVSCVMLVNPDKPLHRKTPNEKTPDSPRIRRILRSAFVRAAERQPFPGQ